MRNIASKERLMSNALVVIPGGGGGGGGGILHLYTCTDIQINACHFVTVQQKRNPTAHTRSGRK